MAEAIIMCGGAGGAASDDCTALKSHVLAGKTAVTSDSNDEPIPGTMPERGDWNESVGMNGSVTIPEGHHSGKGKVTGPTVTQRGAWEGNVGLNSSVTVPEGYHNGKGKVNGPKVTISSVVSFKAAPYSTDQVLLTWTNPSKGPYSGFIVCAKAGSYPANINDSRKYTGVGTNHNLGAANSVIISGLTPGTTYYFRIWTYCTVSTGNMYSGYLQASAKTTASGRKVFTQSGTFTVPANVRKIKVCVVGAGGSTEGYYRSQNDKLAATQGGSSGYVENFTRNVTPGKKFNVVVGAPVSVGRGDTVEIPYTYKTASARRDKPTDPNNGWEDTLTGTAKATRSGSSSFDNVTALGGLGARGQGNYGLPGGSGCSGCAGDQSANGYVSVGSLGTNGGDGGWAIGKHESTSMDDDGTYYLGYGGKGQGKTTREHGASNGTLYATPGKSVVWNEPCKDGPANTGNGAQGGANVGSGSSALGGTGVVIVSW